MWVASLDMGRPESKWHVTASLYTGRRDVVCCSQELYREANVWWLLIWYQIVKRHWAIISLLIRYQTFVKGVSIVLNYISSLNHVDGLADPLIIVCLGIISFFPPIKKRCVLFQRSLSKDLISLGVCLHHLSTPKFFFESQNVLLIGQQIKNTLI